MDRAHQHFAYRGNWKLLSVCVCVCAQHDPVCKKPPFLCH